MNRISMTDENWATAIKIAAVLVAVPRWIGALLEADGAPLLLTESTRYYWGAFSALASAGMALVEGVAFWYTLRAWRQHGGKLLGALIALSMAAFAVVLTPYIMANVTGAKLAQVLEGNWLVAWSSCVSLSTILIVASVGYAQPRKQEQAAPQVLDEDCHCPICYSVIGLPVWLSEQHGDKYIAYCDKCERAYTESEVVWLQVGAQVGASVPQPVATPPQAWKPANLMPDSHFEVVNSDYDTAKSRQNATPSDFDAENASAGVEANTTPENADYQLDKPTAADVLLTFYRQNPTASMTKAALHVEEVLDREYSREAVRQQLKRLEAQGKIERNGQVIVK